METTKSTELIDSIDKFIQEKMKDLTEVELKELQKTFYSMSWTNCPGSWFDLKSVMLQRTEDYLLALK